MFYWDFGIQGLWVGPTFAVFYNTALYSIIIRRVDWHALIKQRRAQLKDDKRSTEKQQPESASKA